MRISKVKNYIINSPVSAVITFTTTTFVLGLVISWAILHSFYLPIYEATSRGLRLSQTSYPLVNPLLLCNVDQKEFNQDKKLNLLVKGFIDTRISGGLAENISVYLINYASGKWVGVNENDRYDPASMLKVPIMIAYYKNAETNPDILLQTTSYEGDDQNTGEYFKSNNDIKPGKMYSIENLIKNMIENSDNTASTLLENYIDKNSLYDVYTDLGLPVPATAPNVEYMSAKLYAYFFRVLYNGTYLDRKYSERALEYLSHADIPGIRAGVPNTVTVSQKFGERSIYNTQGTLIDRELHDCGIIYKENNPYLLCVMSRGKDFNQLAKNISDLSSLVYENIDK